MKNQATKGTENKRYNNGRFDLVLIKNIGDYAIFRNVKPLIKDLDIIVAWCPTFNESDNTCSWSQGHYDMTMLDAIKYIDNVGMRLDVNQFNYNGKIYSIKTEYINDETEDLLYMVYSNNVHITSKLSYIEAIQFIEDINQVVEEKAV